MITRRKLISKYIDFFKSKNHKEIPNSSLIPENDPTVLFTTAGMHPLVPFLLGQKHPLGKRLCNVQKCIRTGDIEEVGDEVHHTFFEMLGNWSLGDYWKKDAINYSFEFLTKELKIPKEKIEVTCFAGDKDAQKDEESAKIWKSLGIKKIKFLKKEDNWWGPAGKTGPCGPDTEMFVNGVEIWNDVFMQYNKNQNGKYEEAKQKNIDTGMGVERTIAILNNIKDNYLTECFKPIIDKIEYISGKKYSQYKKEMRIIADHVKASVFIIADGISPGNTEQGYVLRRLIRRAVRYGRDLGIKDFTSKIAEPVFEIYNDYEILKTGKQKILGELKEEEDKFNETLEKGIRELKKIYNKAIGGIDPENPPKGFNIKNNKMKINGKDLFLLYQSYGLPIELSQEIMTKWGISFDDKTIQEALCEFNEACKIHQELSRTASAGKFKSGLADNSKETTKLHTATHLLLAAIRKILKDNSINQKGSNITAERLRFDFNFPRKLTDKELKDIENEVNSNIQKGCNVIREEMSLKEAKKKGVTGVFEHKYGDIVSVYTIENCSKEICAGPHVKNTCELGKFKILKEESSSNNVRRIKAVVE